MRTNDVYFQAGDKVMRVGSEYAKARVYRGYQGSSPQFGTVYCVEGFYEGPDFNVVMLVGFGVWHYDSIGRPIGWRAVNFRKVDEIKLCIAAVKKTSAPVSIPQPTNPA